MYPVCRLAAALLLALTIYLWYYALQRAPSGLPTSQRINDRPIIGVLAMENSPNDLGAHGSSHIVASYVKYLESAGARVVPIRINRTEEEYIKLFNSINGLFLPGGSADIEKSEYSHAAKIFYNLALKAHDDNGDHFPIWGTCLGFEQLSLFTANKNLRTITDTKAVALPLTFTEASSSRMFQNFPKDLMRSLAEENITCNRHRWSLSMENYSQNAELKRFYNVLSTNNDGKTEFISSMEAYDYPVYGVQWHPEKAPFEWVGNPGMVHSSAAVRASFYTALFFVSEAMKNFHQFSDPEEEERALIYKFTPDCKGKDRSYEQVYYFD